MYSSEVWTSLQVSEPLFSFHHSNMTIWQAACKFRYHGNTLNEDTEKNLGDDNKGHIKSPLLNCTVIHAQTLEEETSANGPSGESYGCLLLDLSSLYPIAHPIVHKGDTRYETGHVATTDFENSEAKSSENHYNLASFEHIRKSLDKQHFITIIPRSIMLIA